MCMNLLHMFLYMFLFFTFTAYFPGYILWFPEIRALEAVHVYHILAQGWGIKKSKVCFFKSSTTFNFNDQNIHLVHG